MNPINRLLLIALLNSSLCGVIAQNDSKKEAPEAPPIGVPGPANAPNSSSKSKRSTAPAPGKRGGTITAETKAYTFNAPFGGERLLRPIVVRSSKGDDKAAAQLQEDLAVMSRILEKSTSEYKADREEAAGIVLLALAGGKPVRAMYLEDYGAVFTLSVNIPLKAQPQPDDENDKGQAAVNEEWTEARNELFGDRRAVRVRAERVGRREFDPHQVDEFRDSLIEALRNASNIRNLRENDWITLIVRGRTNEDSERRVDVLIPGNHPEMVTRLSDDRDGENTMVLRVKKSDVDQLASKKTSPDQFKEKVSINIY